MNFHIITIFPKIFESYFNESIIKRAQDNDLVNIKVYNLRDWATDKHKTVDDTPYGGGAGMVMKVDVLYKALQTLNFQFPISNFPRPRQAKRGGQTYPKFKLPNIKNKVILTSAKGNKWNQKKANEYKNLENIIIVCGRYEGVDERILNFIDEEISIGDFVLTGGEIPAMILVDSITRLLPGVLGNKESAEQESHSVPNVLEYPHYTRPEIFETDGKKYSVPKVLLSGNHKKIDEWKNNNYKKH